MKFSVIKFITSYKTITEDGNTTVDVSTRPDVLMDSNPDMYTAFSIFSSSKKSLDETLSDKASHIGLMVLRVEYEEQDGFVMARDLVPTNFADFEKSIMEDLRFAARQQTLAAIGANLHAINLHGQKLVNHFIPVLTSGETDEVKEDTDSVEITAENESVEVEVKGA